MGSDDLSEMSGNSRSLKNEMIDLLLDAEAVDDGEKNDSDLDEATRVVEKNEPQQIFHPTEIIKKETPRIESVSVPKTKNYGSSNLSLVDAALSQSEHLRVAQERILELESTVEKLRVEAEQLLAAGETLKNRADELSGKMESIERESKEKGDILNEERVVFESTLKSKNKEILALKLKVEELETRLQADLKRVRVRERELENRLEIVKMEGAAVLRNKDEMILELKRRMDQMTYEMDNYRIKGKELNKKLDAYQERVKRTVKALRLALTLLEGDDVDPVKKAE